MSWHFSQAQVAASSGGTCSAGGQSVPSSSTPTPAMFFWPARTTDAFRPSRSGMTCEPLTADRGEALLTWCLAGSRARTSPPPVRAPGSVGSEADSGERWHALLVKFSPDSCGWKTARCLWEEDLDWSCLTLPRWGSLHDGELWERATPGLPTSEKESGLSGIPTPTRYDATGKGNLRKDNNAEKGGRHGVSLHHFVKLWPTPRASEAGPDFAKLSRSKTGISLQTTVAMWPTPRAANPGSRPNGKGGKILSEEVAIAEGLRERGQTFATPKSRDWKGQSQRGIHAPGDALPNMDRGDGKPVGGSLNPTWVEWLMGWPLGWTDCAAPATAKYQEWRQWHGVS